MKQVVFLKTESGSPDSQEWHSWRSGGIGGSEAAIIAYDSELITGKRPAWLQSINWLYRIKTGQEQAPDISNNFAVRRGKDNEEPARKLFEKKTGIFVSPCFGEMDGYPFIRSSFDGLTLDQDVLAEIKVPGNEVHQLAKFGRVVDYYKPQIAHQALTAWGHPDTWTTQMTYFISYVPETGELVFVEKPAKDYARLAEKLHLAEVQFWSSVVNAAPPCGQEWLEKAALYIEAVRKMEEAKALAEIHKQGLTDLLGSGKRLEGGGVCASRTERIGSVDYLKLLQDLIPSKSRDEIKVLCEQYRKPSTESVTIRITNIEKP